MSRRIDGMPSTDQQVTETFGIVPAVEQTAVLPAVDEHYSPDPAERPSSGHRRPRRRPSRGLVGACAGSAGLVLLVGAALLLVSTRADGGAVREQAPTVPASSRPHPVVSAPPSTPVPAVQRPLRRVPVPVVPVPAPTSRRPVVTPRATHTPTPEPTEASPSPSPVPTVTPPTTPTPAPPATGHTSSNRETPCPA